MKLKDVWRRATVSLVILCAAITSQADAKVTYNLPASQIGTSVETDEQFDLCSCCDDCCGCGDACCDCGSGVCGGKKLLGLIAPSQSGFDRFISPMTNPVFFEDPRTLTEARAFFLQHRVPVAAGGGDIQLMAVQLRAAITDRLSIIATKDGFASSSNALIDDGWADVAAGLKYNFYRNVREQRLMSGGFTYEMPVGTPRTLQGNGDGEFHIFLTGATEIFGDGHWISASGFRLPADPSAESSMWYWSNHFDYRVLERWYILTEFNWFNWIGAGVNTTVPGVEGGDLFNFGSVGVAGNNIVTNAVGVKFKRSKHRELGIAFEYPLTDREDVIENRLTVDWIVRY